MKPGRSDIITIGIAVTIVVVCITVYAKSRIEDRSESRDSGEIADQRHEAGLPKSRMSQIFSSGMIGAELSYLESITGPAKNSYGNVNVYEVDGCEVTASGSGSVTQTLRLKLADTCTFDINPLLPSRSVNLPTANRLTFGEFANAMAGGTYMADCITGCGNAADPSIYQYWTGSRADEFMEVLLETSQDDMKVINAVDQWKAALENEKGEDWVSMAKFNCDPHQQNELAHQLFGEFKIKAITIGQSISTPGCYE